MIESTTSTQLFKETTMPSTIKLHRVFRAPPARVYKAFLDADAMVKWLPPNGFTAKIHQSDPRVGGIYKMSFTTLHRGKAIRSAASISNSFRANAFATPINSRRRIYR